MRFARPFRFGAVVVEAASQVFVRVEIEIEGKGRAVGASAEMMVPKWFDKRAHLSTEQTVDELRRSLAIASELYLASSGFDTAFGHHASRIAAQIEACAKEDIPPLAAIFGPAEIDKAILDALLRGAGINFFDGMAANIAGIDARLSPDLANDDIARFLARKAAAATASRSATPSVSMTGSKERAALPTRAKIPGRAISSSSLPAIPRADAARLIRIGRELATLPYAYSVTLDANEQYADLGDLRSLVDRLSRDAALAPIASRLLYIEQPMPRDITRASPLGELARLRFHHRRSRRFL